jgi:uncharacterized protein (TIGR03083 family)
MQQLQPVIVLEIIPKERENLITMLSELSNEDWTAPTMCTGWSVKDLAAHLLGDDIGILNMRDHPEQWLPQKEQIEWDDLVALINGLNQAWVETTRRISAPVLIDFLKLTGEQTYQHFKKLDPYSLGRPVSWAGPEPAPVWLDIAREYTERWVHQQQIREALQQPVLTEPAFLSPVLSTFMRAIPHTFQPVDLPSTTAININIQGKAGSKWCLVKEGHQWHLYQSSADIAVAALSVDQDTAWRMFTNSISEEQAVQKCVFSGDQALGLLVLDAVAIIA